MQSSVELLEDYVSIFIEQRINSRLHSKIELGKSDSKIIKTLVNVLAGNIIVYKIDKKTNRKEDLTPEYGRNDFLRDPKKQLYRGSFTAVCEGGRKYPFYKVYLEELTPDDFINALLNEKIAGFIIKTCYLTLFEMVEEDANQDLFNTIKGNEYEKFISQKYLDLGYTVQLNGIELGINDGGIDLIAEKDNFVVFIQCKNWFTNDYYKIRQIDLKAFIGSCYIYLYNNRQYSDKKISFHFIVSDWQMMDSSATKFILENTMIKAKEVAFINLS
ncbi:restriction endonuclease [Sulfuricurvum sp.]|uniref:restriction endonuclease n=1 Tax=Sulfuricurvum sp. TaxID=2025608 RepID=UPI003BB6ED37